MGKEHLQEILKNKKIDSVIVDSFLKVPRENFVPEEFTLNAYDDIPIPLSEPDSSISQPSTIAFMLQLLKVEEKQKILEIGSGSGYVLALLSQINSQGEILGIELNEKLCISATKRLSNYSNIRLIQGDGYNGLPSQSPFNRIIISASAQDIGTLYALLDQLTQDGILVAPLKNSILQIIKKDKKIEKHEFPGFNFVPLKKIDF